MSYDCSAPEPSYIPPEPSYIPEPSYVPEPPHIIEPHHEPSYSAPPPKPVRSRPFPSHVTYSYPMTKLQGVPKGLRPRFC